jgi:CheY-like chemotaxis protein
VHGILTSVSNNKLLPPGKRILIVDDHKMMRDALRSLLEERLGYECVAEANDGYEAVKKVQEFRQRKDRRDAS